MGHVLRWVVIGPIHTSLLYPKGPPRAGQRKPRETPEQYLGLSDPSQEGFRAVLLNCPNTVTL